MICPNCGGECERDEVDIGFGLMPGSRWGCHECQWVEGQELLRGASPATGVDYGIFRCGCGFQTDEAKTMIAHQRALHAKPHKPSM